MDRAIGRCLLGRTRAITNSPIRVTRTVVATVLAAGFILATLPPSVVDAAEPNVVSFNLCVFNDTRCNQPGYAATGTMKAVYFQNAMAADGPYPLVIALQEAASHRPTQR